MDKKKPLKSIISISIILATLILAVYYISKNIEDFKQISLINPLWLIPLIILFLINYYFIGIQTKVILEPLGVKLGKKESFMLSIVTGFYNLITPARGGMGVRAIYLKKKHNFSYTSFFSSLAGMYVVTFFVGSLFGLISLLLIRKFYGMFSWIIFFVFLGFLIPLFFLFAFSPNFKETKYRILNNFIKVANGWNLIKENKKVLLTCILVTLYSLLSASISSMLSYYVFGIKISFVQALFLASVANLSLLIQITPAGLGINEIISVFSATIIGITPLQSIPVVILNRVVQVISLFTLGPLFSWRLLKYRR